MIQSAAIPLPEIWHLNNYFLKKLLERNSSVFYAMVSKLTGSCRVIIDVNTASANRTEVLSFPY